MSIRSLLPIILATVVTVTAAAPAGAQWINHPTPGPPRTADGKPDLTAPLPRAADAKPDLHRLPGELTPSWMGYSVAHWEGDTCVVETTGYNDRTWLDFTGHPQSEALRVTERLQRTDFGHMQLSMTFEDAKAYTKP